VFAVRLNVAHESQIDDVVSILLVFLTELKINGLIDSVTSSSKYY
jgi:hypothetical protein